MKTWVICERFYAGDKLIDRPCTPDLWEEDAAKRRAVALTQCHGPRTAYHARLATPEELEEYRAIEERRNASAHLWTKVS